jgi:hypothetical protein
MSYSPLGKFNSHDAGSVVANTVIASGSFVAASEVMDAFVAHGYSQLDMDNGIWCWLVQASFFLAIKVVAATLRNNGDSPTRRLSSKFYEAVLRGLKKALLTEVK